MDTKVPCRADKGIVHGEGQTKISGSRYSRKNEPSKRRRKQSSEEAVEAMPKQSRELFPEAGPDG